MTPRKWQPILTWLVIILAVVLLPRVIESQYTLRILSISYLRAVLAVTFAMILRAGHVNMAHVAFAAIGAYSTAALVVHAKWTFWMALPLSLAVVAVIALALGSLILRVRGSYFFLISFCFLQCVVLFFANIAQEIFGGPNGITRVPRPGPLNLGFATLHFDSMLGFYWLSSAVFLLALWFVWRIMGSRYGQVLDAIRQSQLLASTIGIDVFRHKLIAFTFSSVMAGLAGATLGAFNRVVNFADFSLNTAVLVVVYAIVGGAETLWGPVLGAVLLTVVSEHLRILQAIQLLGYGLLLVVVMIAWPAGLAGAIQRLCDRLARWLSPLYRERVSLQK